MLALELNRPPMRGICIDLSEVTRWGDDRKRGDCCAARVRAKVERVYRVRSTLESWKRIKKVRSSMKVVRGGVVSSDVEEMELGEIRRHPRNTLEYYSFA